MRLLIFRLLLICICSLSLEAQMTSRVQVIMGTFITLSIEQKKAYLLEDAFNILKEVDRSISSYNPNSYIFHLNKHKESQLNEIAYRALRLSKQYYKKTNGYFDITIGSVTKNLYAFGQKERIPSQDELDSARIDINGLEFNQKEAFLLPNITVDLGGMGKGFGVDYVSDYFKEQNVSHAIIAASGDIRCLGSCTIDVNDPFSEEKLASFETLYDEMGITTSGNYNRFVKTIQHNHLITPKSKKSQNRFTSITLISNMTNSDLDAYATAASVMPITQAYKFLDSLNIAYIVLQNNKRIFISKNILSFVRNIDIKPHRNFIVYKL